MFHNFGDPEKALEFYGKALSVDPAEPFALYFRSSIYSEQRKFKEAIADADALVAIPRKTLDEYGFIDNDGTVRDFHVAALLRRAKILAAAGLARSGRQGSRRGGCDRALVAHAGRARLVPVRRQGTKGRRR